MTVKKTRIQDGNGRRQLILEATLQMIAEGGIDSVS